MTEEQQRWYEKQKETQEKFGSLIDKLDKNTKRTIPILEDDYRGNYDALYVRTYALYDKETLKHKYLGLGRYVYKNHYFLVYRKGDRSEEVLRIGQTEIRDGKKYICGNMTQKVQKPNYWKNLYPYIINMLIGCGISGIILP